MEDGKAPAMADIAPADRAAGVETVPVTVEIALAAGSVDDSGGPATAATPPADGAGGDSGAPVGVRPPLADRAAGDRTAPVAAGMLLVVRAAVDWAALITDASGEAPVASADAVAPSAVLPEVSKFPDDNHLKKLLALRAASGLADSSSARVSGGSSGRTDPSGAKSQTLLATSREMPSPDGASWML